MVERDFSERPEEPVMEQFLDTVNARIDEAQSMDVPEGHELTLNLEQQVGNKRKRLAVPISKIAGLIRFDSERKGRVHIPLEDDTFVDEIDDKNRLDDAKEFIGEYKKEIVVSATLALVVAGAIGLRKRKH